MRDYINWYVVELRLRLAPHLSLERVESFVREVEGHLREAAQNNVVDLGLSEERAQAAAVEAFGRPDKFALDYLRESDPRLWGVKPIWFVLLGSLTAVMCWDYHWLSLSGFFDNFGETWKNGLAGLIGFAALAFFVYSCWAGRRSFRWPVLGMCAATCIGSIFLLSFWIIGAKGDGQGFSRFHLAGDEQIAQQTIANLSYARQLMQNGDREFARAKDAKDISATYLSPVGGGSSLNSPLSIPPAVVGNRVVNGFAVPSEHVYAMVDGRVWAFDSAATLDDAKEKWRVRMPVALAGIDRQQAAMDGLLASAKEARHGRLFFFNADVFSPAIFWTILFTPLLFLLEAIVFALFKRKRAWPGYEVAS